MKTKKGTILDVFFITFFIVAALAAIIIMYAIFNQFHAAFQTAGINGTELQMSTDALSAISNFNVLMLFVYIGSGMACVVSAFAVRTHPIFFGIFVIVQILLLALTPILQDVYYAVTAEPALNSSMAQFPVFTNIIDYLPYATLILSALVALVMFALPGP